MIKNFQFQYWIVSRRYLSMSILFVCLFWFGFEGKLWEVALQDCAPYFYPSPHYTHHHAWYLPRVNHELQLRLDAGCAVGEYAEYGWSKSTSSASFHQNNTHLTSNINPWKLLSPTLILNISSSKTISKLGLTSASLILDRWERLQFGSNATQIKRWMLISLQCWPRGRAQSPWLR